MKKVWTVLSVSSWKASICFLRMREKHLHSLLIVLFYHTIFENKPHFQKYLCFYCDAQTLKWPPTEMTVPAVALGSFEFEIPRLQLPLISFKSDYYHYPRQSCSNGSLVVMLIITHHPLSHPHSRWALMCSSFKCRSLFFRTYYFSSTSLARVCSNGSCYPRGLRYNGKVWNKPGSLCAWYKPSDCSFQMGLSSFKRFTHAKKNIQYSIYMSVCLGCWKGPSLQRPISLISTKVLSNLWTSHNS